jgi:hypothetical protein
LSDRRSVPPPLKDTSSSSLALVAKVWDGHVEGSLVGSDGCRYARIDFPSLQGGSDHSVGRSINDGNVGAPGVGGTDVDLDGNGLANGPGLDVGG